jgi:hypothetical protein
MELLPIARVSNRAAFELSDFRQPAAMSVRTAEPGAEEVLGTVPRNRDTHGTASEAEYIHVIILHPLPGRKVIVTERRANAGNLIRGHGGADPAAAQQNATVHFFTRHGASEGNRKIRVVIVGVIYAVAKIDDLMALCRQQIGELLLHFEPAVIRAYPYFHVFLLLSPDPGAAQSGPSLPPQCSPR